jgi:hypothetical protein
MKAVVFLAALLVVPAAVGATPTLDGTLTDPDYMLLSLRSGPPFPELGAGNEINALYAHNESGTLYIGLAGNVQSGSRILLFLDTISFVGYNTANYGRNLAPSGLFDFNPATTFDMFFAPDYCVVIGFDGFSYFGTLCTLSGFFPVDDGGPYNFISAMNFAASPVNGSSTQGFEFRLTYNSTGSGVNLQISGSTMQLFAAYITNSTNALSNQFLSPAAPGDLSYGSGPIIFSTRAPNPVSYADGVPIELASFTIE